MQASTKLTKTDCSGLTIRRRIQFHHMIYLSLSSDSSVLCNHWCISIHGAHDHLLFDDIVNHQSNRIYHLYQLVTSSVTITG